ncbi:ImmA/IrrE family metallo-endopeptidase [Nonomuraea spiralis]|uniref:ImmA/IrrE family metallo-endopeptidase n=1 Tax=Nonomuraea spiralis TaxID=46182 RepID=A0ABV5IRP9_9ACTN|nr:ImmA/IrrE family metallo-endopeptidase [Nonomuraea spiralis]GGT42833.1 hypothetical protein GCM10010176_102950 [Nonomuraea spiralis]
MPLKAAITGRSGNIISVLTSMELGHVLHHGKRLTFLDDDPAKDAGQSAEEDEANRFAADTLIPLHLNADYQRLRARPTPFTNIEAFAARAGIAEGIVVGRLQYDRALPPSQGHRYLKRFEFLAYTGRAQARYLQWCAASSGKSASGTCMDRASCAARRDADHAAALQSARPPLPAVPTQEGPNGTAPPGTPPNGPDDGSRTARKAPVSARKPPVRAAPGWLP